VASGFGYFAWNKGATLVDVGALAVMNNVLIPAGILVNLVIWNRDADLIRLAVGGGIILLALWVNQKFASGR
jgi:drug/metabolite transporter (DMT)-like permease